MYTHASQVAGDKYSTVICRDRQNHWIESMVGYCAYCLSKVYGWLSSEQPLPNVGIDISIGLKADFQASLDGASFFALSKRSIMS